MEKETQTTLLREAIRKYAKSEIINSDQGSQHLEALGGIYIGLWDKNQHRWQWKSY